jgi:hypothetical protein
MTMPWYVHLHPSCPLSASWVWPVEDEARLVSLSLPYLLTKVSLSLRSLLSWACFSVFSWFLPLTCTIVTLAPQTWNAWCAGQWGAGGDCTLERFVLENWFMWLWRHGSPGKRVGSKPKTACRQLSFLLGEGSVFVLWRPSADWMSPTHSLDDNLL